MAKRHMRTTGRTQDLRTVRAVVNIRGRDWGLAFGPGSEIDLNALHGGRPLREYMREDCLDPAPAVVDATSDASRAWAPSPPQPAPARAETETETEE